ncbi:putative uncharacterized protein DDB_G0282499 [Gordionus sp. m RMFG-2023]|uniref:putative uncharacterized protein DDB_G0282499 n=1 Tax=Gordionus sp. m RMFG-2023 TaxID=3053472 RepID=UPI0031FDB6E6
MMHEMMDIIKKDIFITNSMINQKIIEKKNYRNLNYKSLLKKPILKAEKKVNQENNIYVNAFYKIKLRKFQHRFEPNINSKNYNDAQIKDPVLNNNGFKVTKLDNEDIPLNNSDKLTLKNHETFPADINLNYNVLEKIFNNNIKIINDLQSENNKLGNHKEFFLSILQNNFGNQSYDNEINSNLSKNTKHYKEKNDTSSESLSNLLNQVDLYSKQRQDSKIDMSTQTSYLSVIQNTISTRKKDNIFGLFLSNYKNDSNLLKQTNIAIKAEKETEYFTKKLPNIYLENNIVPNIYSENDIESGILHNYTMSKSSSIIKPQILTKSYQKSKKNLLNIPTHKKPIFEDKNSFETFYKLPQIIPLDPLLTTNDLKSDILSVSNETLNFNLNINNDSFLASIDNSEDSSLANISAGELILNRSQTSVY